MPDRPNRKEALLKAAKELFGEYGYADRDLMDSSFTRIHDILVAQLGRGLADGSLVCRDAAATAQVIISMLVGVNRLEQKGTVSEKEYGPCFGHHAAAADRGVDAGHPASKTIFLLQKTDHRLSFQRARPRRP